MTDHQPLLQLGTPLRDTDPAYVILRLDDNKDVETAMAIINQVNERLAPLMVGLADTVSRLLRDGTAGVTGQLQAAGLNPVPMAAPQPMPVQAPAQPVYQPQAQASQAYAAPQGQPFQTQVVPMHPNQQVAQQFGTTPLVGPCWAANPRKPHNGECRDCNQPTHLTTKSLRNGKTVNAHICTMDPQHKITWCEETIWNSKVAQANGQGIITDPNLVTG